MNKPISVSEKALVDLCHKAGVKSPLGLIDKKIAFYFNSDDSEIKMFAKISRILVLNDTEAACVTIFLNSGQDPENELFMLMYHTQCWEYCLFQGSDKKESYPVEGMIFETKWWQF